MKTKVINVKSRSFGTVQVKIDAEDEALFSENSVYVTEVGSSRGPFIRLSNDTSSNSYRPYASRAILEKHKKLDFSKNVFYKDGDRFNLRKSNLYQL